MPMSAFLIQQEYEDGSGFILSTFGKSLKPVEQRYLSGIEEIT